MVKKEIASRSNVTLFENESSIDRWENFARQFANSHPEVNGTHPRWYNGSLHRKFAAFDGIYEKFVFFDGGSLAMKPVTDVWEKLETYDFVFDDWEHGKYPSNAALNIALIEECGIFTQAEILPKLHCSSFWGSKRGIFNSDELTTLQGYLVNQGETAWINV